MWKALSQLKLERLSVAGWNGTEWIKAGKEGETWRYTWVNSNVIFSFRVYIWIPSVSASTWSYKSTIHCHLKSFDNMPAVFTHHSWHVVSDLTVALHNRHWIWSLHWPSFSGALAYLGSANVLCQSQAISQRRSEQPHPLILSQQTQGGLVQVRDQPGKQ